MAQLWDGAIFSLGLKSIQSNKKLNSRVKQARSLDLSSFMRKRCLRRTDQPKAVSWTDGEKQGGQTSRAFLVDA